MSHFQKPQIINPQLIKKTATQRQPYTARNYLA